MGYEEEFWDLIPEFHNYDVAMLRKDTIIRHTQISCIEWTMFL